MDSFQSDCVAVGEAVVDKNESQLIELADLQLVLVGGGIGNTVI